MIAKAPTMSLTDRLLNSFPSGSYCLPALLGLAQIEETTQVPTAAVECVIRPRLLLNPEWIAQHAATPEKLVMLTMHELHHVVLGHTRLFPRATPLDNLVFDAVINSMLCQLFPDSAYTSLMQDFYSEHKFPECFLRPVFLRNGHGRPRSPAALHHPNRRHLIPLYRQLYSPSSATYEELRTALGSHFQDRSLPSIQLLGDHRTESTKASSSDGLALRSPEFIDHIRRIVEQWPVDPDHAKGRSLSDLLALTAVRVARPNNRAILTGLIRKIANASSGGTRRDVAKEQIPIEGPIPHWNRRSVVLGALGGRQLLHRQTIETSRMATAGDRVHVYVDVSGSVTELSGLLYGAVLCCSSLVHPIVHLFSTKVVDVTLQQLRNGECVSTKGTSIDCVAEHMEQHRVRRAVIVTDGVVGTPGVVARAILAKCLIGVALTPGEHPTSALKDFARHWITLLKETP